jgi:hypothetical protein
MKPVLIIQMPDFGQEINNKILHAFRHEELKKDYHCMVFFMPECKEIKAELLSVKRTSKKNVKELVEIIKKYAV